MRKRALSSLVAAALPVLAVSACGSSGATTFPAGTPRWIRDDAVGLARSMGDRHPTSVRVKPGLYTLIAVEGKFTCTSCSSPTNRPDPTGTVAVIMVDANTHEERALALCRDRGGFCGICGAADCTPRQYALDKALDTLAGRTRTRGEVEFSRAVGFYRKCHLDDPAAEYGVISGNCRVAERVESTRVVVEFTQTWHGLDRRGRRTESGPLLRHQWGVVLGHDGRVRGFWSSGSPPPQFERCRKHPRVGLPCPPWSR